MTVHNSVGFARLRQWAILLCAAIAGCSPNSQSGVVSGVVTLDGNPLKTGQIRFVPADGRSPSAGAVIADGHYSAKVMPGKKSVVINSPKPAPTRAMYVDAPPGPNVDPGDLVPAKYNAKTELTLEVVAGEMKHDFELKSK